MMQQKTMNGPGTSRVNAYICRTCGEKTITVDVDHGVTPFMIGCRVTDGCNGDAQSCFYGVPQAFVGMAHAEFYVVRKKSKLYRRSDAEARAWYDNGQLEIRARTKAKVIVRSDADA